MIFPFLKLQYDRSREAITSLSPLIIAVYLLPLHFLLTIHPKPTILITSIMNEFDLLMANPVFGDVFVSIESFTTASFLTTR